MVMSTRLFIKMEIGDEVVFMGRKGSSWVVTDHPENEGAILETDGSFSSIEVIEKFKEHRGKGQALDR